MKLKKWFRNTLLFIQITSMIFLVSIEDFILCWQAVAALLFVLCCFVASSVLLLQYGGYEHE